LQPENERHPRDVVVRYTRTAIALHWLVALIILVQIPFGWSLGEIPTGTPARGWYVNLHKSVGITLGVVIVLRVLWRWFHPAPPLTGYVASNFSKWGVKYFNTFLLPPWGVDDPRVYAFFNGAHVATSYLFLALILAHAASAVRHASRHDGILQRMWPARRGEV